MWIFTHFYRISHVNFIHTWCVGSHSIPSPWFQVPCWIPCLTWTYSILDGIPEASTSTAQCDEIMSQWNKVSEKCCEHYSCWGGSLQACFFWRSWRWGQILTGNVPGKVPSLGTAMLNAIIQGKKLHAGVLILYLLRFIPERPLNPSFSQYASSNWTKYSTGLIIFSAWFVQGTHWKRVDVCNCLFHCMERTVFVLIHTKKNQV